MNKQEVFDKVATHLLTQMEKSSIDEYGGLCAYRGDRGTKCAIGCLIPDELYRLAFEGTTVDGLLWDDDNCPIPGLDLDLTPFSYLRQLQDIHDTASPHEWFAALENFGLANGLSTDCLDPFRKNL